MKTMMFLLKTLILFKIFTFASMTFAQSFSATITAASGDAKILSMRGPGKTLLYEGLAYHYKKARIGRKVKPDQIVLTGPNGKVKIIYNNGDHFNIGPGSSLRLPIVKKKSGKKRSELKLYYGKFRALISKKGPRKNLTIKSRSAVAGVRGTDFFISDSGAQGAELTVVRGVVAVASSTAPVDSSKKSSRLLTKAILVKKGYSATIGKKQPEQPPKTYIDPQPALTIEEGKTMPNLAESARRKSPIDENSTANDILVLPITKEDLIEVQKISSIAPNIIKPTPIEENIKKEIDELNQRSAEAVLQDLKEDDLKLYQDLKKKSALSSQSINTAVVAKLFKQAPREKVKQKLSKEQLETLNKDIYDKYFKVEE